ncbi:hypothetical protein [Cellulomonas bogoriensis]|nr:hypothetical protein [Cellulomonas bogoriensis]
MEDHIAIVLAHAVDVLPSRQVDTLLVWVRMRATRTELTTAQAGDD